MQLINGLSLNATNYKEATEILHERYENKQVVIRAHMQKILQIEVCVRNWHFHLWSHISTIFKWKASFRNQSDFMSKFSKRYLATARFAKNFKKRG